MSKTGREEWSKRVQRWGESGLTAKEFAAETGLKASTLSYWKWRLRTEQRAQSSVTAAAKSGKLRGSDRARVSTPTFVELAAAPASVSLALELVLHESVTVRIPVGFDEATLSRVLRVVGASR